MHVEVLGRLQRDALVRVMLTSDRQAIEKLSCANELHEEGIPYSTALFAASESSGVPNQYEAVPSPRQEDIQSLWCAQKADVACLVATR